MEYESDRYYVVCAGFNAYVPQHIKDNDGYSTLEWAKRCAAMLQYPAAPLLKMVVCRKVKGFENTYECVDTGDLYTVIDVCSPTSKIVARNRRKPNYTGDLARFLERKNGKSN